MYPDTTIWRHVPYIEILNTKGPWKNFYSVFNDVHVLSRRTFDVSSSSG